MTEARILTRAEVSAARSRALHARRVAAAGTAVAAATLAWGRILAVFASLDDAARDAAARRVTAALMAIADETRTGRGSRDRA